MKTTEMFLEFWPWKSGTKKQWHGFVLLTTRILSVSTGRNVEMTHSAPHAKQIWVNVRVTAWKNSWTRRSLNHNNTARCRLSPLECQDQVRSRYSAIHWVSRVQAWPEGGGSWWRCANPGCKKKSHKRRRSWYLFLKAHLITMGCCCHGDCTQST